MNVFTNESYIKEQFKSARRMQLMGIGALVLAFLISCPLSLGYNLHPVVILLAYPFLLAGFPLLTMGNNRLRRLRAIPRADLLLNTELKGLNNKYSLHHYAAVDGKIVKHLLVAPAGLLVVESRDTTGQVMCASGPNGDRWRVRTSFLERISGTRPPLGNPSRDLQESLALAKGLLESIGKPAVEARGLIVFTRQEDLEVEGCSYPVVPLSETKAAVRQMLGDLDSSRARSTGQVASLLTSEDRRRLNAMLAPEKPVPPAKAPSPARSR
jgi:hypothetical protein